MIDPNHPATARQIQAADPAASTWVSANAGSGKTRVLTNRVSRLLLDGVDPARILCLTYTKAAAGEMQNRLFQQLGGWAMLDDMALTRALSELGENRPANLDRARSLFARAVDTPGGLRIQTIHAFCGSILRRFPVEAQVSPQFIEIDERQQGDLIAAVLDTLALSGAARILANFVARCGMGDDFAAVRAVLSNRTVFGSAMADVDALRLVGLPEDFRPDDLSALAFDSTDQALIQEILPVLAQQSKIYSDFGEALARLDWQDPSMADYQAACDLFLYTSSRAGSHEKNDSKSRNFPQAQHTKAVDALAPWLSRLHALMDRVAAAKQAELALDVAKDTAALHTFAAEFLDAYDRTKSARGWLDFDDLILKTGDLLSDPSVAAWVQYRLDGGIDHVLLDEAQDTSPAQWRVIEKLTEEFGAGDGQQDPNRTIFVVGDPKQSIYSFQGADAQSFDRMKARFKEQLQATSGLNSSELEYSFRSSPAILSTVDHVLPDGMASTKHRAFWSNLPGRVDLWPVVPKPEQPADTDWHDPVDRVSPNHESAVLSRRIAAEVRRWIDGGETLPDGKDRRVITPADILILVRGREGRGDLFQNLIRALKSEGLAVAGADRFQLAAELAVKDLLSLLRFLALPEDDLSLAEALRSPLFGLSEADLYDVAANRGDAYLWARLRETSDQFSPVLDTLFDLLGQTDLLRPYELLDRVLTRHDGRRKLLARLGADADDAIDELLSQALHYETTGVPSLTGFVAWFEGDAVEVKRQHGTEPREIRVMTVHGAKGLEAPIVILPDTMRDPARDRSLVVRDGQGAAFWRKSREQAPAFLKAAQDDAKAAEGAEALRLMYVAMTRAKNWLVVCGAGAQPKDGCWYDLISRGVQTMAASAFESPVGQGHRISHGDWDRGTTKDAEVVEPCRSDLPAWLEKPAPAPTKPTRALSPSDLGGAKALPGENDLHSDVLSRGRAIHRCLEILPDVDPDMRASAAANILRGEGIDPEDSASSSSIQDALRILNDPGLAWVFGSETLAEVDVTAILPTLDGVRVAGAIDRLWVTEDAVHIVDFKSNTVVPETPEEVPDGLLRQMGAYAAAVSQIYPGRTISTYILWTVTAEIMILPHEVVRDALQRATIS